MKRRATASENLETRTLEIASLLGREVPLALLRTAGGSAQAIESLFERGVLAEGQGPGQARFVKASEARKVAAGIPWSRRRRHQAALGDAARRLRFAPEEIAPFFESAQQPEVARDWWTKAAQKACRDGAYSRAMRWLDRALGIWPWNESPDDRVAVLREMARCAVNGGKPEAARRAWEELADYAADNRLPSLQVEALRQLAGLASDAVRITGYLKQAAQIAENELSPAEAVRHILLHVDNLANRVHVATAADELTRAVKIADDTGDPALLSEVRGWQGLIAAMAGNHARADQFVEESLRLAVENDLAEQAALAYRRRANIRDYGGRYAEEQKAHTAAIDFCRRTKAGGELVCLGCLSYACFRTGDWREAVRFARKVAQDPNAAPTLKGFGSCVLGLVHAFRGERGPAARHLEAASKQFRMEGITGMEFFALWGLAYLRHADGDAEGAIDVFDQVRSLWRETDDVHDVVPALLFAGAVYADCGSRERLTDCLDILGRIVRSNPLGEAKAALAALQAEQARLDGRAADAATGMMDAAERYAVLGLPTERVWTECRRVIHGGCHAEDASLAVAVGLAKRLGMRPMLAVLRSDGGSTAAEGDLTPRQAEVLRLLARGLTSKEIADRLGLSTRTVEMHVGRLLQRLNCRTRPEAVRLAIERRWLRPDETA